MRSRSQEAESALTSAMDAVRQGGNGVVGLLRAMFDQVAQFEANEEQGHDDLIRAVMSMVVEGIRGP